MRSVVPYQENRTAIVPLVLRIVNAEENLRGGIAPDIGEIGPLVAGPLRHRLYPAFGPFEKRVTRNEIERIPDSPHAIDCSTVFGIATPRNAPPRAVVMYQLSGAVGREDVVRG